MNLNGKASIQDPCVGCKTCRPGGFTDGNEKVLHIGNYPIDQLSTPLPEATAQRVGYTRLPHWNIGSKRTATTYKGLNLEINVATSSDVTDLIASTKVFLAPKEGAPGFWPQQLAAYTNFLGLSYPYICIARVDGKIVAKLFLDPNPNNAIRRNLNAAIIDNVIVDPAFEGQGVADQLLEFTEDIARANGVRWLEIGAARTTSLEDMEHQRKGTDSLRSYIRRGYYEQPLYLDRELVIHYQASGIHPVQEPSKDALMGTFLAPRYGKAVVVYKDLDEKTGTNPEIVKQLFEELTQGIPA